jgi:hypothetical protein
MGSPNKGRAVEASALSTADHKIVCDFEEGCTSLESQVRRKTATRPVPAGREAVKMFSRGFPLFSSWPSARIVVGNAAVCAGICRRFGGGSDRNRALLGNRGNCMHDMQIVQSP